LFVLYGGCNIFYIHLLTLNLNALGSKSEPQGRSSNSDGQRGCERRNVSASCPRNRGQRVNKKRRTHLGMEDKNENKGSRARLMIELGGKGNREERRRWRRQPAVRRRKREGGH
jgi:hypothetical protein